MMLGWSRWRRPGARRRTRAAFALVAIIMSASALTSPAAAPETPQAAPAQKGGGGGVPGLPPVANDALTKIQQDSVLGSLVVILLLTILGLAVVIWKRQGIHERALEARDKAHAEALKARDDSIEKTREEWESQLNDLHEARLSLFREVMTALGASTAVIQMHAQSTQERTHSSQALTDKVAELIATSAASRAQFHAIASELARQGQSNTAALERISYKLPGGA